MVLDHALEILALVVAVAGFATVVSEIVTRDPGLLREIVTDVRAMARPGRSLAFADGRERGRRTTAHTGSMSTTS
ncbi:MAG TPA: hypothetical protein VD978_16335 [Azospirillum sp.]|nr:hypothetical protein [Azospirillum sp.]